MNARKTATDTCPTHNLPTNIDTRLEEGLARCRRMKAKLAKFDTELTSLERTLTLVDKHS